MNTRLERLRASLRDHELAALLVTSAANRRYLSGFRGSAGALLITATHALLFTDFRYASRARQEAPACTVCDISAERPLYVALRESCRDLGVQHIAFEAQHMNVAQFNRLQTALEELEAPDRPRLQPVEGVVEALRETKDADELTLLCQAIELTDTALAAVLPLLTPQHSERQAAWMLEAAMRERGAEAVSFPIIVAAGANSANPHAEPGDNPLGSNQPIVIDMGARYAGYHADLTRTVVLGVPDERFWHVYQTVLEAQQRALDGLHVGLTGDAADALARDYIAAAGFGEAFGHSLGHGVGLEIHEGPTLRRSSEQTLCAGNVFSVEPGIYLDGWGGVRIEDLVLLRADGYHVLSQAPKQPVLRND